MESKENKKSEEKKLPLAYFNPLVTAIIDKIIAAAVPWIGYTIFYDEPILNIDDSFSIAVDHGKKIIVVKREVPIVLNDLTLAQLKAEDLTKLVKQAGENAVKNESPAEGKSAAEGAESRSEDANEEAQTDGGEFVSEETTEKSASDEEITSGDFHEALSDDDSDAASDKLLINEDVADEMGESDEAEQDGEGKTHSSTMSEDYQSRYAERSMADDDEQPEFSDMSRSSSPEMWSFGGNKSDDEDAEPLPKLKRI